MRESYPPADDRSSPALPELPQRTDERFQFGIKMLLFLMLVSAVLATGLHYGVVYFGGLGAKLPAYQQPILVAEAFIVSILLAAWLYFLVRFPSFSRHMRRFNMRWKAIHSHRQDMAIWTKQRREKAIRASPPQSL